MDSIVCALSESRAIPLVCRCIRQPRYEAAMTEAPAAMASLCRERPPAGLAELVVCIPRRRAILVMPLSILRLWVGKGEAIRQRRDSGIGAQSTEGDYIIIIEP
jgi:hypothetical protein